MKQVGMKEMTRQLVGKIREYLCGMQLWRLREQCHG
jgi:hypothetical protein